MRVLQVTPYFAPAYAYGGPPETVHKLSKALADRGHEVTVLTTDAFSATARQAETHRANDLDIYYLRNLSNYLAWNRQMFLPIATKAFLRRRVGDFDIIHIHSFRTYQNVVVRQHALKAGIPYVLSAHGSVPTIVRMQLAKKLFDAIVGRNVLQDAVQLIAVSNAELRQYEEMGLPSSRISVIPNGIDASQYAVLPARGAFARANRLQGKRLVTYIGRLSARKGLDTLLKSFQRLLRFRDDIALVLVGPDDGYRGHIERMVKQLSIGGHVLLTGLITLPRKLEIFVDSDVIVYPGAFEIFGLVPFEGLLCGRPVVVANDSGCGEIVERTRSGVTFAVGDCTSLADAIAFALDGGIEIQRMIENGRRFVLERLNWSRIAEETERVYDSGLTHETVTLSSRANQQAAETQARLMPAPETSHNSEKMASR